MSDLIDVKCGALVNPSRLQRIRRTIRLTSHADRYMCYS